MTETTTDQLVEIEAQAEDTPATEYTPPEGWRVLLVGEPLKGRDEYHAGLNGYIRRTEPQPAPIQVREGRWRTRDGNIRNVTPTPAHDSRAKRWPWRDAKYDQTWREDGGYHIFGESPSDLVEYLGPIEPDKTQELETKTQELDGKTQELPAATIEELRSEVSYVQRLLGESRQRVTQLEELVGSLRAINEAQEKAFNAAGKANTDLQHRLNVVAAEWAEQAETIRRLQIELDAAQQVPQAIADRFEEGWNQGTARAVETVLEWLEPIRAVDHPNLSNEILQHLPQIMRHLTGLAQD